MFPSGSVLRRMKALIVEPDRSNKTISGVIVYHHGTIFNKSSIPTNLPMLYSAIGALYVSKGYIVIFPNYIGLGSDFANSHPYVLFPQQLVRSSFLVLNKYLPDLLSRFNVGNAIPVFSAGYSEGGAYALWFLKCAQYISSCPYVFQPNTDGILNARYKVVGGAGL